MEAAHVLSWKTIPAPCREGLPKNEALIFPPPSSARQCGVTDSAADRSSLRCGVLTIPWNSIPAWRLANYGALSSRSMIITTNTTIMLCLFQRRERERERAHVCSAPGGVTPSSTQLCSSASVLAHANTILSRTEAPHLIASDEGKVKSDQKAGKRSGSTPNPRPPLAAPPGDALRRKRTLAEI